MKSEVNHLFNEISAAQARGNMKLAMETLISVVQTLSAQVAELENRLSDTVAVDSAFSSNGVSVAEDGSVTIETEGDVSLEVTGNITVKAADVVVPEAVEAPVEEPAVLVETPAEEVVEASVEAPVEAEPVVEEKPVVKTTGRKKK